MGSDLGVVDGRRGLHSPVIAESLRSAASLRSPDSSLQAVIGMAMETGPWAAGSICTVNADGSMDTAAYLDVRAQECDRLQLDLAEGPAHDALRGEQVLLSADLVDEPRWASWSPAAVALGVRSTLSLRLFTDTTLGTINLYSRLPWSPDAAAVCSARVIAAHASVVVGAITTERHLRRAMQTRNLIGQAQGVLMQRYGLTADGAFDFLRRCSQHCNIKLVVLAGQVAGTGVVPDYYRELAGADRTPTGASGGPR